LDAIGKHLHDVRADGSMPYLSGEDKLEILQVVAQRMQDGPTGLAGNRSEASTAHRVARRRGAAARLCHDRPNEVLRRVATQALAHVRPGDPETRGCGNGKCLARLAKDLRLSFCLRHSSLRCCSPPGGFARRHPAPR